MSTGTARAWNQILATKTSKPPVSSDRSYNKRLGLICIIIWTTRELLLIVWLGHKHITLSPLFETESYRDAWLLREKKSVIITVTQQLQQAAETYSVDQTHVIVRRGYLSPWHYGKTLKTSSRVYCVMSWSLQRSVWKRPSFCWICWGFWSRDIEGARMQTMCSCVWLCVGISGYLLLYVAMCVHVWLCLVTGGHVWLCVLMCGYVLLGVPMCGYMWLCVAICAEPPPPRTCWSRHSKSVDGFVFFRLSYFYYSDLHLFAIFGAISHDKCWK